MDSIQDIFMKMLDDPQIREKIRAVVWETAARSAETNPAGQVESRAGLAEQRTMETALRQPSAEQDAMPKELAQTEAEPRLLAAERDRFQQELAEIRAELEKTQAELALRIQEQNRIMQDHQAAVEQLRQMESEAARLKEETARQAGQIQEAQTALSQQRRAVEQAQAQLSEATEKLRQTESTYRADMAPFAELKARYNAFLRLPENRRADLSKVTACGDPVAFLISGSQRDAPFGLWDYLKSRLNELSADERETLMQTLQYFLNQYNLLWKQPIYEWMDGETGKAFDDQRHSRSSDCSRYQGNIEKVLLPGIWNWKKKSAERKCIVYY